MCVCVGGGGGQDECEGRQWAAPLRGGYCRTGGGHPFRPARGYRGAQEAPPSGSGAEPQKLTLFALKTLGIFMLAKKDLLNLYYLYSVRTFNMYPRY